MPPSSLGRAGVWGLGNSLCLQGLRLMQVVLWVGLGILVVSTHSTLSVNEETPVDLDLAKEAPGGRLGEAQGEIKVEVARLPGTQLPGMRMAPPCSQLGACPRSDILGSWEQQWNFLGCLMCPTGRQGRWG